MTQEQNFAEETLQETTTVIPYDFDKLLGL